MDPSGNEGIQAATYGIPDTNFWKTKSALLNTGSGSCYSFLTPISILNSTVPWLLQSRVPTLLHLHLTHFRGTANSAVHHPWLAHQCSYQEAVPHTLQKSDLLVSCCVGPSRGRDVYQFPMGTTDCNPETSLPFKKARCTSSS